MILIIYSLLQNVHGGYPEATLERFLKARDGDVTKAAKMVNIKHLYAAPNWLFSDVDRVLNNLRVMVDNCLCRLLIA